MSDVLVFAVLFVTTFALYILINRPWRGMASRQRLSAQLNFTGSPERVELLSYVFDLMTEPRWQGQSWTEFMAVFDRYEAAVREARR